jgi:hypothetical protein
MKHLTIMLIICVFILGCNTQNTIESKICEKLQEENINTSLVLFFSEGMCSECINIEFQNIKENSELINSLVIIGVLSKKRDFYANVNSLAFDKPFKKVYIDIKELNEIEQIRFMVPLYFVYNSRSKSISNRFQAQGCNRGLTVSYFEEVQEIIEK